MKTFPQIYAQACLDLAQDIENGKVLGVSLTVIDDSPNCTLGWLAAMSGVNPSGDFIAETPYRLFEDLTGIDDRDLARLNDRAFQRSSPDPRDEQSNLAKKQLIDMLRHVAIKCKEEND